MFGVFLLEMQNNELPKLKLTYSQEEPGGFCILHLRSQKPMLTCFVLGKNVNIATRWELSLFFNSFYHIEFS